jgi:hypothetical protein
VKTPSPRKVRVAERIHPVGLVLLLVALAIPAASTFRVSDVEDQRDTAQSYTLDLADRTLADCSMPDKTPDPATCEKAAEVKTIIEQRIVEVPAPRRTDAEVRQLLEDVLRDNPDILPRGPKGETPTVDYDRIVREVQDKIPTPERGPAGEPAPPIDYERIIREVVLQIPVPEDGQSPPCLSQPGQCMGEKGEKGEKGDTVVGPAGRGVASRAYVTTDSGCVERITYTQDPYTEDFAAPASFCILNGG